MKIQVKKFNELTTAELYEILKARAEVFVVEQNCVYQDLDSIDQKSIHVWLENGSGKVLAYLRTFEKADELGTAQIGRVLTTERGQGLGSLILKEGMKAAVGELGAKEIYLEAQVYAIGFYEKEGFKVTSGEFLEDGIPHVQMRWRE